MLEQAFIAVNSMMQTGAILSALGFLLWGVIAVIFSPCHLLALPLIVGYLAGQKEEVKPRQGFYYALSFTLGVFLTIAAVGIFCSLLGRMLGEVGPYWTILVGAVLLWVGFDMLGVVKCPLPSRYCGMRLHGLSGAFCIGLAYGVISGSCTFGFIAPILALITIQHKVMTGIFFIVLFGLGYSIPLAVVGSSTARVKKLVQSSHFQKGGLVVRKFAGVLIGILGVYFLVRPLLPDLP